MMAKQITLVTGSRYWGRRGEHLSKVGAGMTKMVVHSAQKDDALAEARMCKVFQQLTPGSLLLQGLAPGADLMAQDEALEHGLFPVGMPYARFLGKGGGPARNRKMLTVMVGLREAGWKTRVVSFHEALDRSKGTVDMVRIALAERFIVHHVSLISTKTLRSSDDLKKYLRELKG
jgi:hypothetical protein